MTADRHESCQDPTCLHVSALGCRADRMTPEARAFAIMQAVWHQEVVGDRVEAVVTATIAECRRHAPDYDLEQHGSWCPSCDTMQDVEGCDVWLALSAPLLAAGVPADELRPPAPEPTEEERVDEAWERYGGPFSPDADCTYDPAYDD